MLQIANDNTWAGLASFNKSVTSAIKMATDIVDYVAFLGNPDGATLFPWAESLNDLYGKNDIDLNKIADETNKAAGHSMDIIGGIGIRGAVQALPSAIFALLSFGTSLAPTTATLTSTAANEVGGLLTTISNGVKATASNPQYWTSFIQNAGSDYDQAIKSGASKDEATTTAIVSGLINGVIETNSIQALPEELVGKDRNAIFKWVKTSIDEGNEGPVQNVLTQLISKAVYDPAKPMFSLTDQDAVFNPSREATQWAGGTFAGGMLSALPIAANKLMNNYSYDSTNDMPPVMLNEGQNMFYGDLAEGYAPENLHSTKAVTIEDSNLDLAQEHLKDAAFAKDFAETPESFKNNLMTSYRSAGNTRQVKVVSGAVDGAPYDMTINKSTVENVVGNPKVTAAELAVLKNLDAIVKNSTYVKSSKGASLSGSNQPVRHDYFETPVTLGGETYVVRLDVAVKKSSANIKPQSVVEGIEVVRAQDGGGEKAGEHAGEADNYRALMDILSPRETDGGGISENVFFHNETSDSLIDRLLTLAKQNREVYNGKDTDVELFLGLVKNPQDYLKYAIDIGTRTDVTLVDKIRLLQKAFDGLEDKTDIVCPKDVKYVKSIDEKGRIEYNWPPYQGFDLSSIEGVTQKNIPELWSRIGSLSGANFTIYPEHANYYTYDELALPYKENPQAQHGGTLYSSIYFKTIDAIAMRDFEGLNAILRSNGKAPLMELEFMKICSRYEKYQKDIEGITTAKGDINTKYGLVGKVGSYDFMLGGALQFFTPLDGVMMNKLGLIEELK